MIRRVACLAAAGLFVTVGISQAASPAERPWSATASKVPARFWGVDPVSAPSGEQFTRLRRGRVDTIRYPLYWSTVQPASDVFDWSGFDRVVSGAARRNIDVLPYLYASPRWVAGDTRTLPVNTSAQSRGWARFLRRAAARYGPGGSFWRSRPAIDPLPVTQWQIWNEQNYFYFAKPVSPRRYARLLKLSARALRSVNPTASILLGGMFGWPAARPPRAYRAAVFLRRLYGIKGTRKAFDGVALHPYSPSARYVEPQVVGVRRVMRGAGDRRTGLWITEMGWASSPPGTPFGKGSRGQARELGRAFSMLRRNRRVWRLRRVFWFSLTDDHRPDACSFCGSSGLFTSGFRAKPAWRRFVAFSGGRP